MGVRVLQAVLALVRLVGPPLKLNLTLRPRENTSLASLLPDPEELDESESSICMVRSRAGTTTVDVDSITQFVISMHLALNSCLLICNDKTIQCKFVNEAALLHHVFTQASQLKQWFRRFPNAGRRA